MPTPPVSARVIFCPLEIEAKAARKSLGTSCTVIRTGPGPEAIRRAIEHADLPAGAVAVLFGTAGGLAPVGITGRASTIIDTDSRSWDTRHKGGAVIAGVNAPVCKALEKQALARRTGASIVDCESHIFAPLAIERAWRWAVVRGITDDHNADLPPAVIAWAGADGRTRLMRVLASMLRDPRLIAESIRLGRKTSRALRAAGLLLRQTIDDLSSHPMDARKS